ncbi:MAG TPA: hemolysin III family protein [Candidatus Dormibacteraeota bacterium]|nr:hemolysin III family protein [Candidatus Dormibacteraeota bacterium]
MELVPKPMLRGWSHAVGAVLAVAGVVVLVMLSRQQPAKAVTMLIYGLSLVLLLGVSAVYHIGTWRPRVRAVLRGLDHANIFLFIAASYTAVVFNALTGWWRTGILASVWLLAVAGMATLTGAVKLPRWAVAGLYVALGWVGVVVVPQVASSLGLPALSLILLGGLLYSTGALAYAFKRPRLWPRTFGYHEVFHLLVLGASASFFVVMALYVIPYRGS